MRILFPLPTLLLILAASAVFAAPGLVVDPAVRKYCLGCHQKNASGGINLQLLYSQASVAEGFQHWEKVASALEDRHMPPARMPQPSEAERMAMVKAIRERLAEAARRNAGDPGRVTVRRLTSGEYEYTVRDLTGLDFQVDKDFADDSVGGEGFTNFGDVQFMQDANLERYLSAAKRLASHAVIGSGKLSFFADPGKSGFELSAISRIQKIYRENGFRSASGEGGKAFGLDRYSQAILACWRYGQRQKLGQPSLTLAQAAAQAGASARFVAHIWQVFQEENAEYPTSEAVRLWKQMPASEDGARAKAKEIQAFIVDWPRLLFGAGAPAMGGEGDERNFVLSEDSLRAKTEHKFRYPVRGAQKGSARVWFSTRNMNPVAADRPYVIWKNASVRFRTANRSVGAPVPLRTALKKETVERLRFGQLPDGGKIDELDFALPVDRVEVAEFEMPEGAAGVELTIDAVLGESPKGDAVIRAMVTNSEKPFSGVPMSVLLGQPKGEGFAAWKRDVLEFSTKLAASSHGEPTPADKDPIPAPYNNIYNQPERDSFHVNVKYYRDDRFLYSHILNDGQRQELDHAWNDLLASFGYHEAFFTFVNGKYKLGVAKKLSQLSMAEIEAIPAEPRQYVKALRAEYDAVQKAQFSAQPGHVNDVLQFASRAWRRDLTAEEKDRLRGFYVNAREGQKLDHEGSIRALLARVLVSPNFLYRLEAQPRVSGLKPLSGLELASRLSFFLWSSAPDAELMRAARAGELVTNAGLETQVKRMMADGKARRFATEFFGQWLGFYKFDQFNGVDSTRFPEFDSDLKQSMYDEAVSFFEHIVRADRPVREMFSADYTFLNKRLAQFYGVGRAIRAEDGMVKVEGAREFSRGGLLRLGAVLAATSAPLRTSPVKRGDWVLRRLLGTPTPPPPPNAGMIPADEKNFGGMTLKERLAAHQRNATCAGCHSRIDPLGFPFEKFDATGKLRQSYADGRAIEDQSVTHDKKQIAGVDGLAEYLKQNEKLVLRNFSRKLLGYALGRTMAIGDQPLIEQLAQAGSEATLSRLVSRIVTSPQFRQRRGETETLQSSVRGGSRKEGGL